MFIIVVGPVRFYCDMYGFCKLGGGVGAFVYADRLWWRRGGKGPRREESKRPVCVCAGSGGARPIGWLLPCAVAGCGPMADRSYGGNRRSNRFPLTENSCCPRHPATGPRKPGSRDSRRETVTAGSAPKIGFLRVLATLINARTLQRMYRVHRSSKIPSLDQRARTIVVFFFLFISHFPHGQFIYLFIARFFTRKIKIHYFFVFMNTVKQE